MMKFRVPPAPYSQIRLAQEAFMSGDEEKIKDYLRQYAQLPSFVQSLAGYSLAAMYHVTETCGLPAYTHFFCKDLPKLRVPFAWIGWAGGHSEIGPAFAIDADCFTGEEITLYYSDDDLEVYSPSVREDRLAYAGDLAKDIAALSSGLRNVRAVVLPGGHDSILTPNSDKKDRQGETCAVAFTLDRAAVRPSVLIQGRERSHEETGGFVFVLPRAGEFKCTVGELFEDGLRLPLRTDSYCMK